MSCSAASSLRPFTYGPVRSMLSGLACNERPFSAQGCPAAEPFGKPVNRENTNKNGREANEELQIGRGYLRGRSITRIWQLVEGDLNFLRCWQDLGQAGNRLAHIRSTPSCSVREARRRLKMLCCRA